MSTQPRFDFGFWMHLARTDPQAFERRRRALLDEVIRNASPERRRRLAGLQFRIDLERERAVSPMAACLRLSAMMWDSLYEDLLPSLRRLTRGDLLPEKSSSRQRSATVIPFRLH